jgi:hypothetical protein
MYFNIQVQSKVQKQRQKKQTDKNTKNSLKEDAKVIQPCKCAFYLMSFINLTLIRSQKKPQNY